MLNKCRIDEDPTTVNLTEISQLLLNFRNKSIETILGELDARKLRSSMTIFSQVENANPIFQEVLDAFFSGYSDPITLSIAHASIETLAEA